MQQQRSSRPRHSGGGARRQPRVVILDAGDRASVAVLDLPKSLEIGGRFCHSGTRWCVVGQRPGSRVFIAVPAPPQGQGLEDKG